MMAMRSQRLACYSRNKPASRITTTRPIAPERRSLGRASQWVLKQPPSRITQASPTHWPDWQFFGEVRGQLSGAWRHRRETDSTHRRGSGPRVVLIVCFGVSSVSNTRYNVMYDRGAGRAGSNAISDSSSSGGQDTSAGALLFPHNDKMSKI